MIGIYKENVKVTSSSDKFLLRDLRWRFEKLCFK